MELCILLHVPNRGTQRIRVRSDNRIGKLAEGFEGSVSLMRGGVTLNPNMTFDFYGVKNDDVIFVVREDHRRETKKWLSMAPDQVDHLERTVKLLMDTESHDLVVHRLDVRHMKLELRPSSYRRMLRSFCRRSEEDSLRLSHDVVIIPEPPEGPAVTPLPVPY